MIKEQNRPFRLWTTEAYLFIFLWQKEIPESTWPNVCMTRRMLQEDILTSIQSITSSFLAFLFKIIFLSSSSTLAEY